MSVPKSAKMALWTGRLLAFFLLLLTVTMPALLRWYQQLRPLGPHSAAAILIGFYCCLPVVLLALWNLDRLLRGILAGEVFVPATVRCISRVRWCCLTVSLICTPAAVFYPPLVFMVVIMGFLTLVVSVVVSVMDAAVSIREENDLTI